MKQFTFILIFTLAVLSINGQEVYSKTYGSKSDIPVIFIHGGPGGNSTLFEATTAQRLADEGFYVIVYDRRGEGRSQDENARMTYKEAFDDLNALYDTYNLKKANLIAHSFGGLIATLFAEKYPQKVESIILAGALFSQQKTYDHILKSVKEIYTEKNDSIGLDKVFTAEKMDINSSEYRKICYDLAGENGFFKMPRPTRKAYILRQEYKRSDIFKGNIRNENSPKLFYQNEPLKNIDVTSVLKKLKEENIDLYAIYGKQDLIFSDSQINELINIVGEKHFRHIDNCSHYLFADRQEAFVRRISKWLK